MKLTTTFFQIAAPAFLLFLAGCGQNPNPYEKTSADSMVVDSNTPSDMQMEGNAITSAVCVLHPTEGNSAKGTVWFTESDGKIEVKAELEGLTEGKHGFHIHEKGNCSAADGTSAGGHFNPQGLDHGALNDSISHVGDMGNITAGADGKASLEFTDEKMSFYGENSILGRAIIVHAGEDDLKSQPTGDAGGRVACGVIGIDE